MKILMVNKFLFPNGGSETYIMSLGRQLETMGHQVEYFGMWDDRNTVGNKAESYTSNMEFHGNGWKKLFYPFKIIYSKEARKRLRKVLDDFEPEVIHLNNFNFQITPSVFPEIRAYEKRYGKKVCVVYTAHDYQLLCPNHLMRNFKEGTNCEKCVKSGYINCMKNRCIHGSVAKSLLGTVEAVYWNKRRIYGRIDKVICPSRFMESKIRLNPLLEDKTIVMHNFVEVETKNEKRTARGEYVLYFGRFSEEKGVKTLVQVAKQLPEIPFVFAGSGPLESELEGISNVRNVGFQKGDDLIALIQNAAFTVCPSECYENCPFTVMESQMYGVPVIGADIGGIPELIQDDVTGLLFSSQNAELLKGRIEQLWNDAEKTMRFSHSCSSIKFDTLAEYTEKLLDIYRECM